MIFLYEWDEDKLTSLILNISKDLLAQNACYSCLFHCTIERDMKNVCTFVHLKWDYSMGMVKIP